MPCFKTVVFFLVFIHACGLSVARLVDDGSLGITRYDFRGIWNGVPGILTVYLRPVCIGRTLFVRGVLGVITVKLESDSTDRYTAPAGLVDYKWSLRLVDRSTNTSTPVTVYKTVDRGEKTLTFSQLEAHFQLPSQLDLFVEGSPWRHELYLPDCALSAEDDAHPLKQLPGGLFNDKHWLIVMLPRVLPVPAQQYSQLLLSHMRYHQQLGFAGTLLLCDMHQAHELTQLQEVNDALQQDSIIMWPWHHEHPQENHPLYWQVPRYQLVAVAGWGHAMRAAFLDVDDFLVIPSGQLVTTDSSCLALQTSQTDLLHQLHWEASLPPGALVTVSDDDDDDNVAAGSDSNTAGSGSSHTGAAAVLRLPRFDALLEPGNCQSASACSQQHSRWYEQPGTRLAVSTCPVEQGGMRASRRPLVTPHEVVAMRVYTASSKGGRLNGPSSPPSCGYLLHITNMLGPAKPWGFVEAATWQPPADGVLGQVHFTSGRRIRRQSLQECLGEGSMLHTTGKPLAADDTDDAEGMLPQ